MRVRGVNLADRRPLLPSSEELSNSEGRSSLYKCSLLNASREPLVHGGSRSASIAHGEDDGGCSTHDIPPGLDVRHRGLLVVSDDDIAPLIDFEPRHGVSH